MPGFGRHLRVEHDLELQVAELVGQGVHVVAADRVGDLIGFLDRVGRDGREILLAVPFAAGLRIAQPLHDRDEAVEAHRPPAEGKRPRPPANPKV